MGLTQNKFYTQYIRYKMELNESGLEAWGNCNEKKMEQTDIGTNLSKKYFSEIVHSPNRCNW